MLFEFLAQGAAVDAKAFGRAGLILLAAHHRRFQQGAFDLRDNEVVEIAGLVAFQRFPQGIERCTHGLLNGVVTMCFIRIQTLPVAVGQRDFFRGCFCIHKRIRSFSRVREFIR